MRGRAALLAALVGNAAGAAAATPAQDYLQHCAGCHMEDGAGSAPNDVPDMRGSIGHFLRLPAGRAYLVQVAGAAQAPLPDPELAELINWMLPTFSAAELPAGFTPYSGTEVAELRRTRPADLAGERARIAASLRELGYAVPDY